MTPAAGSNASALSLDTRSLDALRAQSKQAPKEALAKAASQFEALFMQMLMKSMRDALPKEDMLGSEAARTYTSMLDGQLAQQLAAKPGGGKGIGLAEMMVKQLSRNQGQPQAAGDKQAALAKLKGAVQEVKDAEAKGDSTPENFVRRMSGAAAAASQASGIPAPFMLGQAALESGWGKREIRAADGAPSHNLFGIKAGEGWKGRTVETATTEYGNGLPQKTVARFRAYDSYDEAFRDYARLIGGSRRYAAAAREQSDPSRFAQRIQAAGYATDPRYADKLTKTINRTLALTAPA